LGKFLSEVGWLTGAVAVQHLFVSPWLQYTVVFFSREFSDNIHELAVDAFVYENCSANMDSLVEFCTGSPITQGKQVNLKRTVGRGGAFQVGVFLFVFQRQSFSRTVPVMFRVVMFLFSCYFM
jgi:hypothetical protein